LYQIYLLVGGRGAASLQRPQRFSRFLQLGRWARGRNTRRIAHKVAMKEKSLRNCWFTLQSSKSRQITLGFFFLFVEARYLG
jgi:hypothetical protein